MRLTPYSSFPPNNFARQRRSEREQPLASGFCLCDRSVPARIFQDCSIVVIVLGLVVIDRLTKGAPVAEDRYVPISPVELKGEHLPG